MKSASKDVPKQRNLYLRIPSAMKESLQELARSSNMSVDEFVTSIVEHAIDNGFGVRVKKEVFFAKNDAALLQRR